MSNSSTELEKTIIEASALLVTLLFIIAQVGEASKNPGFMAWLGIIAFFLIGAMIASVLRMMGEFPPDILRAFFGAQILLFLVGLTMLAITFFAGAVTGGYGFIVMMSLFLAYVIVASALMAYLERRRLKKMKQPMTL